MKISLNLYKAKGLLGALFSLFLVGCEESYNYVPPKNQPMTSAQDPVKIFCGEDCSGCDFNINECQSMVKANLTGLCEGAGESCYTLWLRYSKTCEELCATQEGGLAEE